MRTPPAAARGPRQHLWWRWKWLAGDSGWRKRKARRTRKLGPDPTAMLTDDLLVEILARVPYRSLRRCLCVCQRWRALISNPDNTARLPQTIAGIFYPLPYDPDGGSSHCYGLCNVSGTGPSSIDASCSFLPDIERESLSLMDCCNGLILCRRYRFADDNEFHYLVVNPATEKWVAVPGTRLWSNKLQTVRLGFDPAASPHFYVFEFQSDFEDDSDDDGDVDGEGHILRVKVYSSATGAWIDKQSGWSMEILLDMHFNSVFLDGVLYVIATQCIIGAVDVKGETWRIIEFPRSEGSPFYDTGAGFLDLSQGRLHLANDDDMVGDKLAIWVLEDKDSEEWTLKHTVLFKHLAGGKPFGFGFVISDITVVAIHPDRNMVFYVLGRYEKTLMSYDMDSGKVSIIRDLGRPNNGHFLPYVPLFSNSLPDGGNQ